MNCATTNGTYAESDSSCRQAGPKTGSRQAWRPVAVVLCLLLLGGFWIRLSFLEAGIYYSDEFITMLAASMVARHGLPILPSGLFYDQGLPLSLASGALIAAAGFREEIARWPALLVGVFTIAAYYAVARRLFGSRLTGLLAAALIALDPLSIVWSGRARGYSLAHLLVLLSLAAVLVSTFKQPSRRGRLLFLVLSVAAILSHNVAILIVLPIVVLVVILTWLYRRDWLRQPGLWWEAVAAVLSGAVLLAMFAGGHIGSTVSLQDPYAAAPAPLGIKFLRGFFLPGLELSRFDDLLGFLAAPAARWMLPAVAASLVWTLVRLARRRSSFFDVALLFMVSFLGLLILEQGALLTRSWQAPRLLYVTAWPVFLMVCAFSLARVLQGLAQLVGRWRARTAASSLPGCMAGAAGLALILCMWGPSAWGLAHSHPGTGDYNTAFEYVRQNLRPGDEIITFHTSAAYLYAGQSDYYANQTSAKVLETEDEETPLVDRYTGRPLIDTVDRLNAVLAAGPRVWFVVDKGRLYYRYEPFFRQQILAQMELAHTTGDVLIFLSRPHPVPLPKEPTAPLDGDFANVVQLGGYSLPSPSTSSEGTVLLGLFWRPLAENPSSLGPVKVFVQLRDRQNETVAQADHFVYQGLLTVEEWGRLRDSGEWLRDAAELRLPHPMPAAGGPYRIFVGLYNPQTMKRAPLLNDTSGESAVVIELPELP
jgi:4-amino-4-deoxy-L-arabinose transferase-like glycosyltransferase